MSLFGNSGATNTNILGSNNDEDQNDLIEETLIKFNDNREDIKLLRSFISEDNEENIQIKTNKIKLYKEIEIGQFRIFHNTEGNLLLLKNNQLILKFK